MARFAVTDCDTYDGARGIASVVGRRSQTGDAAIAGMKRPRGKSRPALASKPIEPGRLRAEMIFSRPVNAPPHTNTLVVDLQEFLLCAAALRRHASDGARRYARNWSSPAKLTPRQSETWLNYGIRGEIHADNRVKSVGVWEDRAGERKRRCIQFQNGEPGLRPTLILPRAKWRV